MPLQPLAATFPCCHYGENVKFFVPYWNSGVWGRNGRTPVAGCCQGCTSWRRRPGTVLCQTQAVQASSETLRSVPELQSTRGEEHTVPLLGHI